MLNKKWVFNRSIPQLFVDVKGTYDSGEKNMNDVSSRVRKNIYLAPFQFKMG
jgi:hypothetical protein